MNEWNPSYCSVQFGVFFCDHPAASKSVMVLIEFLVIVATAILSLYLFYQQMFKHWEKKGIPFRQPSFPFGNNESSISDLKNIAIRLQRHYDYFKARGVPFGGIYSLWAPVFIPLDPELYKRILVTDFEHFVNRGFYHNIKDDPLSGMLFFIDGNRWRRIRAKLTPTFTSGKMKMMYNILWKCSKQMVEVIDETVDKKDPLDVKQILSCFAADVICSSAFGLECNTCRNPDEEFLYYGKKMMSFEGWRALKRLVCIALPGLCRKLGLRIVPKDVSDFFSSTVGNTIEYRNKHNIQRKDFLQLLIELYNQNELNFDEVAAQALTFFLAGYETSSLTATFALYELSLAPEIQSRAREEVNKVIEKYNGEVTYESLGEMTYLGQVIDETLRKFPVAPITSRRCVKDYIIPGTDKMIHKNTLVYLSFLALHRDPDYFPDPEKFDPERFNEENKKNIKPFTYLPFGDGPRNCIGRRFGLMQTRLALAVLLHNYEFTLNDKTKTPFEYSVGAVTLDVCNGIYLNLKKIDSRVSMTTEGVENENGYLSNNKVCDFVVNSKIPNGNGYVCSENRYIVSNIG